MWWVGGRIGGVAAALGSGLLASMFTAIFGTRLIFEVLLGMGRLKRLRMRQWIGPTKINFISKQNLCYGLSLLAIIVSTTAFILRADDRYGVDFTGGLLQEYQFSQVVAADDLRGTLAKVGLGDAVIQQVGAATDWFIRTPGHEEAEIQATMSRTREAINADYGNAGPQLVRVDRVGPVVGAILRQKAFLAIVWSMVGILFYVAVRFRHLDFGVAGVIALVHDVVIAAGALCLLGRQIDLTVVAALLTIAGFSINDTIVIYDRVRENRRIHRKMGLADVINLSINETLSRTLLTSLTATLTVLALLFFGGELLRSFSICLLVGFVSGVYSTVFVASAIVVTWERIAQPKRA